MRFEFGQNRDNKDRPPVFARKTDDTANLSTFPQLFVHIGASMVVCRLANEQRFYLAHRK